MNESINMQHKNSPGGFHSRLDSLNNPAFLWPLRIAGLLLLLGGLQAWGFNSHVASGLGAANESLVLLMEERASNNLANHMLRELQGFREVTADENLSREIVRAYEGFIELFNEEPRLALERFAAVVGRFSAQSERGESMLLSVRADLARLQGLYNDHYTDVIADIETPPWYLQPLASLVKSGSPIEQRAKFNHALYLTLVKDRSQANTVYNEVLEQARDPEFISRVQFARARLLFDAFQAEQDVQYFQQTVQNLQRSLQSNAEYDKPKLLLEFLLSLGQGSVEATPIQGEGEGESEGERGVISSNPPIF